MSFDLIIVLCTRYHNIISDDIRFYINVNAYSGIRYLLHFIAIACDWYHLIQTKSIKINNTNNADIKYEYSNKANSFLERKSIIEEIIKY